MSTRLPVASDILTPPTGSIRAADATLTSAEVERRALALAVGLAADGVRPGDRVLVEQDGTVAQFAALLALIHLDASIVVTDATTVRGGAELGRLGDRLGAGRILTRGSAPVERAPVERTPVERAPVDSTPLGRAEQTQLRFGPWLRRPDALISLVRLGTARIRANVRSGPDLLPCLDSCTRTAVAAAETLLCLAPPAQADTVLLVLGRWSAGHATVLAPVGVPASTAVPAGVAAGATAVVGGAAECADLITAARRSPALRAAAHAVRAWYRAPTTELVSVRGPGASGARFTAAFGRPLHDLRAVTTPGSVLFDGACDADDLDAAKPPAALLQLVRALRDDPHTLDRILAELTDEGPATTLDPAHRLVAAFDAELRRQSMTSLAATA